MGTGGSLLIVTAFVLLFANTMKLYPPKKITFWSAVIIEAVGMVIYVVHLFPHSLPILDMVGFLFFVAAFILLYKSYSLNPKND